eukprot:s3194_g2.t1
MHIVGESGKGGERVASDARVNRAPACIWAPGFPLDLHRPKWTWLPNPGLEAPTQIDLLPRVGLEAVTPSCLVLSESLGRGDDEATVRRELDLGCLLLEMQDFLILHISAREFPDKEAVWNLFQKLGQKHQKKFPGYKFLRRGGLSSPHVRYVTDADVIFNNPNGGLVTVEDFDVLGSLALQLFDGNTYAARIARDGAELLDEEISDLRAVRSVVEQGCDVATLVGIFTIRNGWCVPVDLTLQCGESDMTKDERIHRILGNLENLDFAKVISRIRAILPKNDKAEFAEAWNNSGGALRFLVKQIHISNYMSEARQQQYLRNYLHLSGAHPDDWANVVTTSVHWIKPGHVLCVNAHQRWIEEYGHLSDIQVGGGHLFDRRSELQIDLITVSSIPQVLSDKVYLPLVRKPNIAEVSPKTIQIARSATALPHLRLTGTGIHTGLDGCCTISTDQAVGSPKEDRLKVLTRPTWLYRWPGAPPKSWRRTAKAEGPFSARCEMPSDVVEMVGRRLFVTYSPNCHQFPVQGHWVDLVVAPTIQRIWPSEVIFDAAQPTRVTATGIGFIGEDLRLRIAGRLATGLQVHNDSAISFAFLIEVSLDGGLFWLSSGIQLTYKHLPAIYALAPTLIVQGERCDTVEHLREPDFCRGGDLTSSAAAASSAQQSRVSVSGCAGSIEGKLTMNQRRTPLLLLVVFAALSYLAACFGQLTFVAPKDATLPKRAKDVSENTKTELQDELERVEALRQDSLEACLLAAEDESQLEFRAHLGALSRAQLRAEYSGAAALQTQGALGMARMIWDGMSRMSRMCCGQARDLVVSSFAKESTNCRSLAMAEVASASSFQSLLLQLERQHAKEVEELHAEIEKLKAEATAMARRFVIGLMTGNLKETCRTGTASLEVESVEGLTKPPEKSEKSQGDPVVSAKLTLEVATGASSRNTEEPRSYFQRFSHWVQSDQFELFVACLVACNFFTMAAEIQYDGLQLGYELGHRFMTMPAAEFWPGAEAVFSFFRTAFLVAFTTEIVLRVCLLRFKFCKTPFNIIDFAALLAAVVELFSLNLPVDPTMLRLCRLAKLFRTDFRVKTIRVLRVSGMLDSLSMLARCMSSSGLTLIWSLLFLLVIQLIAAMMVCLMVRPYLQDESNDQFELAVLTLFEVFFANWSPACRILTDNVTEWYSLLFLIYRCAIGFAVINVVNAVFVQQTLQVAKGDEEVLFLEKQKAEEKYFKNVAKIFEKLDTSGDGLLSWSEFEQLLEDPKLRFLLDKLEIAAGDAFAINTFHKFIYMTFMDLKVLFDLLDDTGDGEISVEEFIEGVTRFKGNAKSLDVGQVLLRSRRLERHILNIEKLLTDPNDECALEAARRSQQAAHKASKRQ